MTGKQQSLSVLIKKFFKKYRNWNQIDVGELECFFGDETNLKYTTPTQFQHFKKTLLIYNFIEKDENYDDVFILNWKKITEKFKEFQMEGLKHGNKTR